VLSAWGRLVRIEVLHRARLFALLSDGSACRRILPCLVALFIIFAGALTGGCAVKLAPDYDKAIFDGLTAANQNAMVLFASAESGPYSKREAAYDETIGQLAAVQVQIKARGTPAPPPLLSRIADAVDKKTAAEKISDALEAPTAGDVVTLIRIMNQARRDDQNARLKRRLDFHVEAFSIQMAQALAYEKALQR
jgi:hypothetical protein